MATKNISITEAAYRKLAALRIRENESFSEIITRIASKRTNLDMFFGALSEESANEIEKNVQMVRKMRRESRKKRMAGLFGDSE